MNSYILMIENLILYFLISRLAPLVKWAQRVDRVLLTVAVEDIAKDAKVNLSNSSFYFHGKAGHDNKTYEFNIEFYGAVDVEVCIN